VIRSREIKGFPKYYATSDGKIISYARGFQVGIKPILKKSGYLDVRLNKNKKSYFKRVNRLVCEAFHKAPPTDKYEANHIDCNKINNHYKNLEWLTPRQNKDHAMANNCYPKGEDSPVCRLTNDDIEFIKWMTSKGFSPRAISLSMNIPEPQVRYHKKEK